MPLVSIKLSWDPAYAEYTERGARNYTYLSNRAQNDLIYTMGGVMLKMIVEDIKTVKTSLP